MIPTSSDFKEQLKNSRGAWHELIRVTLQNNTELVLTDENIWSGGFRINDAVSSEDSFSVLGSAIINQANLTINNIQGQYSQYDFLFAKVELYIGLYVEKTVAYIKNREAKYILDRVGDRLVARVGAMELLKKGEWTVVSQPDIANASLIDLELYDGMYKLDKTYDSTLTFPSTIGNVVSDICTHCGVTLQSATFPNYNITIQTRPDLADTTYREVLAYMCQLSGNYARFNAAGKLELKWIDTDALDHATDDDPSHGDYFILDALYSDQISVEDIVITGVRVQTVDTVNDAVQELSYLEGTEGYVITVSDNPFVNASNYQAVALRLGTQLNGLRFRKMTVTHRSDPSIEAGDIAQIVDGRGNKYPTIITNTTLSTGSSQESICSAESAQRNSADRYSKLTRNYVQMRKFTQDNANAIDQLGEAMQSMGGMYETTEVAPGGGYYYYLHNKPNLSESPIQLKVTDEAVAVTANGLDAHPTWYGLTVDGTFIGNILKAYNSVIVGNEFGSHVGITQDYMTFYGDGGDIVGRISYGDGATSGLTDYIYNLPKSDLSQGFSVQKTLFGRPTSQNLTYTMGVSYHDGSAISVEETTNLVGIIASSTETLSARGLTCTFAYDANRNTVTATIDNAAFTSDDISAYAYVNYTGEWSYPHYVFGKSSSARGNYAMSVGNNSTADGDCAVSFGLGSSAISDYQAVFGKYNNIDFNDEYALIIGNGTSESDRYNIFVIDWNGNVGCEGGIDANDYVKIHGSSGQSELNPGSLELHHATPYIDFHFGYSQGDYTSRIIESSSGVLNVKSASAGNNALTVNGNVVYNAGNSNRDFTSGTVTLGSNLSTLGDAYCYYDAKMIFIHAYFRTTADISANDVLLTLPQSAISKTNINCPAWDYSAGTRKNCVVNTTSSKTVTATATITSGTAVCIDLTLPRG